MINLVNHIQPDILLTMETNQAWENALNTIDKKYTYNYKVPKENRYGMHFYTYLKVKEIKEHYFISETRPAIEVYLDSKNNIVFSFWGIHPPPPSPTEKPTSKQKDAELMKVAQIVRDLKSPSFLTGDFNNVSWSRSAKLFAKISTLRDARLGNGILGTFLVTPKIFRFPLDLVFHSKEIKIHEIKTLSKIGSDHLPIFSSFTVNERVFNTKNKLHSELKEKSESIIEEGLKAFKEEVKD